MLAVCFVAVWFTGPSQVVPDTESVAGCRSLLESDLQPALTVQQSPGVTEWGMTEFAELTGLAKGYSQPLYNMFTDIATLVIDQSQDQLPREWQSVQGGGYELLG